MRRSKPLAFVAGAAMLSLAACGGGGSSDDNPGSSKSFEASDTDILKDEELQGPAEEIEGATAGGTITVYLPDDPGPEDLDPTNGWSVTGNSIQQALTHRALTQYKRTEDGTMILVPDLSEDLGQPNEDFTEWTFTIREDAKWETGDPITAEEVAFGIERSLDSAAFPSGPGTEYSVNFFAGADKYKGPYTDAKKADAFDGITFDNDARTVTIKMAKPFPDMDYWGAFMAMGPAPLGDTSTPPEYGRDPLATGPYKIESFRPSEELVLVKNDQWVAESDPARHQYADKWVFKFSADPTQVDEIMLSGNAQSQTSLSASLSSANYAEATETLGDRLVQQSAQCTSFWAPDYTKITDLNVRKALAYAYRYEDVWLASGEVPGVTRVPANSIMPPGMAGKPEYQVDGEQITYNPEKAKELLAEAGYEPGQFKITMAFNEGTPTTEAAQEQIEAGLKESGFSVTAIPVPIETSLYTIWTDPSNKINKRLNLRGVNWCSDWPSGSTMLPALLRTGATYNTAFFSEESVDQEMNDINELPLEEQPEAWGALDEKIATEYFPIIPTAFRNDLFAFGERIGNPTGDGALGAPNYKDLYVAE